MDLDYDALMGLAIDIGYHLQVSGAEIYRVEESISRILRSYGLERGEVFVIPSCIIIGLTTPTGQPVTCMRRIPNHGTDIYLLEAFNNLCRRLCSQTPTVAEARAMIQEILSQRRSYSFSMQLLGYFTGTAFFSFFFNGTLRDALCGGLCGLAISGFLAFMDRLETNSFFKTMASSALSGFLALFLFQCGLGENIDSIIIGGLMALVPGLTFTSAMRDVMAGDMVSGISKVAEALLVGVSIALGTGFALTVTRFIGG